MPKKAEDQYNKDEAQRRFEAALKGARVAGHKPMSEISPQPEKKKAATKAKPKRSGKGR